MTKIGQIKKEKVIFDTILMGIPRDGQERGAPAPGLWGAMTRLHLRFITS